MYRPLLTTQVPGRRLTEKFRRNNYSAGFAYTPGGRLPPRRTSATSAKAAASATGAGAPAAPDAGSTPGLAASASSPPRRIVADFKTFGAAASTSVFGAPMLPTGPGGGMFGAAGKTPTGMGGMGGMRGGADDDDDDDDEDESGTQLRREAISLDQARRIATQSVFRAGRLPI